MRTPMACIKETSRQRYYASASLRETLLTSLPAVSLSHNKHLRSALIHRVKHDPYYVFAQSII